MSFGTPTARLSRPLKWSKSDNISWIAIDGNGNISYKIVKLAGDSYQASYTTPSMRLCAGPRAPFLNLGTYYTLSDAKEIAAAHEGCSTIPVFEPGKLVGWVDKDSVISLRTKTGLLQKLSLKTLSYFRIIFLKIRRFFSVK